MLTNFWFTPKMLLRLTCLALALILPIASDGVEASVLEPVIAASKEDATPTPEDDDVMIPGMRVDSRQPLVPRVRSSLSISSVPVPRLPTQAYRPFLSARLPL